jgi:hypothetical protein
MSDVQLQEPRPASGSGRIALEIPLQVSRPAEDPGARRGEPVRVGVPFPKGSCAADAAVRVRDAAGVSVPVQTRVLDRWSDGSVRWMLVDLRLDSGAAEGQCVLSVEGQERRIPHTPPAPLAPLANSLKGARGERSAVSEAAPSSERGTQSGPSDASASRGSAFANQGADASLDGVGAATAFAREDGDGVIVNTGAAWFRVDRRGPFPFSDVRINDVPVLDAAGVGLQALDEQGQPATLTLSRVVLEESGPVRAVVLVEGALRKADGGRWLTLIARLHFVRGLGQVECHVTIRNPRRAEHPGGCWDLGDAGSVLFKDLSLTWQLAAAASAGRPFVRYSAELGQPFTDAGELLEIYQDSSGGENWRSLNHLNRNHEIPVSFRGYRLTTARGERMGLRATPIVSLSSGTHTIAVAMRDFWQNCPKAIDAGRDGLALRLFPKQYADLHELQGGEQKTHVFTVSFTPGTGATATDPVSHQPLLWARSPVRVHPSPAWYSEAEATPYLTPRAADTNPLYLALVDQAIAGDDTFVTKREVIDQYGWRHYGDLYGDHEAVRQQGGPPLISHYNNQYDVVWGLACQFMRSGDWRWRDQMEAMAAHVIDIDLYHTDEDKAAYNQGLFWHTYHYVDVDTGTHRSYPAKFRHIVHGGGPSSEQNYATGLMLLYFMTGNVLARDSAIALARFVIAIDDGTKTVFRWVDRGYTGLASASGSMAYHGPGRGPGNSVAALVDGHRITGDRVFLAKAEQLIRRCIHPQDDIEARNLLDAERRWYYTMFLQAVGKYLDHKAELGELDEPYAYARASLLHYARWMAQHEYPYLEKPEILEYPTETWPAQDMRKSQVFKFAARHADEDDRGRFLERAQFFFDYSTRTLTGMPAKRALARPVVLLLANGLMHAWFQARTDPAAGIAASIAAPRPSREPASYGRPQRFVTQRDRAKTRVMALAAAGGAAILAGVVALGWWLLSG